MSTRRDLDDALRAWGDEPGPAPDPAFLARLEHRLRHDDGAVEVDLQPAGRVVPLRRRVGIAGVAAMAVAAVATAAAAMGTFAPEHGVRVDPGADPTEVTLPVTVSSTTTVAVATTAGVATAARTTTAVVEPTTTEPVTTAAAEVTTAPTTPPTEPATTRATVAPPTAPPFTEPPATTVPPATTAPTTPPTTEVHPVTTFSVTCAYAVVDTRPAIVCEWSEPPGGAASYRILKGDQQASVGRVLSPTPGTRRYVDRDIVSGHTYSYLVHALDAGGAKTGQSNLVAVACCTA